MPPEEYQAVFPIPRRDFLRDLKRFIGVLHVTRFGYENPVCLLKVEERTPDIR